MQVLILQLQLAAFFLITLVAFLSVIYLSIRRGAGFAWSLAIAFSLAFAFLSTQLTGQLQVLYIASSPVRSLFHVLPGFHPDSVQAWNVIGYLVTWIILTFLALGVVVATFPLYNDHVLRGVRILTPREMKRALKNVD